MDEVTKKDANKKIYMIFAITVLVQLIVIIFTFQFKKEGYHSDELWSYGYANSYFDKDIFMDDDGNDENVYEWVEGSVLKSYIVVDKGEQFKYDSVYSNQIKDLSPPLHSMILHTICSFFPGKMSRWFSFSINIVSFVVVMIFLFKICRLMMDEKMALLVCLGYGFTQGALDTYIYLRMYAMCTALFLPIVYYSLRVVMKLDGNVYWKNGIKIFLLALAAFFTHYYMISICGLLTAFLCLYMLIKKDWKTMLKYGLTMTAALLSMVAIFPSLISNSTDRVGVVSARNDLNFELRFRFLMSFIVKKNMSMKVEMYTTNTLMVIFVCFGALLLVLSPLLFLFRKTEWFARKKKNLIYAITHFKSVVIMGTVRRLKKINWIYIIFFVVGVLQMFVIGETTTVYAMGPCVDRYMFYMYPLFFMMVVAFVKSVLFFVFENKKVAGVFFGIVLALILGSQQYFIHTDDDYFFERHNDGEKIKDIVKGKNVILIMGSTWTITAYADDLADCKSYFITDFDKIKENEKDIRAKLDEGAIVLINSNEYNFSEINDEAYSVLKLKRTSGDYKDLISYLGTYDNDGTVDKIGEEDMFHKVFHIYEIN